MQKTPVIPDPVDCISRRTQEGSIPNGSWKDYLDFPLSPFPDPCMQWASYFIGFDPFPVNRMLQSGNEVIK